MAEPRRRPDPPPHDCALCRALLFAVAEAERLRLGRRGTLRVVEGRRR